LKFCLGVFITVHWV